jgi:hypothetical protein
MAFVMRKISRIGQILYKFKLSIKPISLTISSEQPGEVWIELKRGNHIETTKKHEVAV